MARGACIAMVNIDQFRKLKRRHSGMRLFGAGPESILTMVVMDSGLAPSGAPRNDDLGAA
jgi:hypothetical protein